MSLTTQEKQNAETLWLNLLQGDLDQLPELEINEGYELFRSALADYGSEYISVLDSYDPNLLNARIDAATLAFHLCEERNPEILPPLLPDGSDVIHVKHGVGRILCNGAPECAEPRVIVIHFRGDKTRWLRADDASYVAFYPSSRETPLYGGGGLDDPYCWLYKAQNTSLPPESRLAAGNNVLRIVSEGKTGNEEARGLIRALPADISSVFFPEISQ